MPNRVLCETAFSYMYPLVCVLSGTRPFNVRYLSGACLFVAGSCPSVPDMQRMKRTTTGHQTDKKRSSNGYEMMMYEIKASMSSVYKS